MEHPMTALNQLLNQGGIGDAALHELDTIPLPGPAQIDLIASTEIIQYHHLSPSGTERLGNV
jgi:hypothetical protein